MKAVSSSPRTSKARNRSKRHFQWKIPAKTAIVDWKINVYLDPDLAPIDYNNCRKNPRKSS